MPKPCDVENLRPVFQKIMHTHQLRPGDVQKDRAKVHIHSTGHFDCHYCSRGWKSNFSWITFDLINLEITYRWKMKCKNCLVACEPTFQVSQLENMYEKAIQIYKGCLPPASKAPRVEFQGRSPHRPALCEKCLWGQILCWKGFS